MQRLGRRGRMLAAPISLRRLAGCRANCGLGLAAVCYTLLGSSGEFGLRGLGLGNERHLLKNDHLFDFRFKFCESLVYY